MSSVQPLKLIAMYLSLSTRQAILFKSSAKKYQQVCTELGGVSSWNGAAQAADYTKLHKEDLKEDQVHERVA